MVFLRINVSHYDISAQICVVNTAVKRTSYILTLELFYKDINPEKILSDGRILVCSSQDCQLKS